ncbi:redoxin domain-containing protein [Zavarzinia sp. CC-PAN008]|uniref:redoxin domain-containing protein n=1 Tax=Zavarzinia sp. CC-PAN008 TaxID=3243332 RepID=UPI003F749BD5
MTRRHFLAGIGALALALGIGYGLNSATSPALAAPTIGAPAPAFQVLDTKGATRTLDEFKGKTVVLEWTNDGCPYVQKHYNSGNMQSVQRDATGAGVVWLTVISSAPGTQGFVEPAKADDLTASRSAAPTAVVLDPDGAMGKAYGAQVTPHMYIIDGTGTLVFMGGIDDKPQADPASLDGARNHVRAALDDLAAGRPVAEAITRPYGCTIKYQS